MPFPASPSNGDVHAEGYRTWQYQVASNVWALQSVGAVTSYVHIQTPAASTWVVDHNLGYNPAGIAVENAGGDDIEPGEITYVNTNQLTINFLVAVDGKATVS